MLWLLLFVGLIIVAACIVWSLKGHDEVIDVCGRGVFISGCDSGFGQGLALRLDKLGMKVFAGCLTTQVDIDHAANIVASTCPEGLWALVNNAGVAFSGEWDWFPEKYLRLVMDINFFGHVAVTKAFLGQIKKTKGRIINLTSVAGFYTEQRLGAYSCSKYAMEAFSDSLRREMHKWGVSVFIVEPAFTATPMVLNAKATIAKVWNEVSEDKKKEYGEGYYEALLSPPLPPLDHPDLVLDVLQSKVMHKQPSYLCISAYHFPPYVLG